MLEEKAEFSTMDDLNGETGVLAAMLAHNANYLIYKAMTKLQENVSNAVDTMVWSASFNTSAN